MKVEYEVDSNLYLLLNFLQMLKFYNYNNSNININNKINELINIIDRELFNSYEKLNNRDIINYNLKVIFSLE